ncbi:hypothetical protein FQZ97_892830 [compost metagenome]
MCSQPGCNRAGSEQPPRNCARNGKDDADSRTAPRTQSQECSTDHEPDIGHGRQPQGAAPDQPEHQARKREAEPQQLSRYPTEQHGRQRDEQQCERKHRASVLLRGVKAEHQLRPAVANHTPTGTWLAAQDLPALAKRACLPDRVGQPGPHRDDHRGNDEHRCKRQQAAQPAAEEVLANPAQAAALSGWR